MVNQNINKYQHYLCIVWFFCLGLIQQLTKYFKEVLHLLLSSSLQKLFHPYHAKEWINTFDLNTQKIASPIHTPCGCGFPEAKKQEEDWLLFHDFIIATSDKLLEHHPGDHFTSIFKAFPIFGIKLICLGDITKEGTISCCQYFITLTFTHGNTDIKLVIIFVGIIVFSNVWF